MGAKCAWVWVAFVLPGCGGGGRALDTPRVSDEVVPCAGEPFAGEVCIQGGEFLMGHDPVEVPETPCEDPTPDDTNNDCGSGAPPPTDYAPIHLVRLSPFFIDRDPVTNAQYLECFEAGLCQDECTARNTCGGAYHEQVSLHDPALASYPVAGLEFEGAEDYCRWAGKRLPTEAEWERAARGRQSFDYPWGNSAPDCSRYPCASPPFDWDHYYFQEVGSTTGDISPEGVRGLVTSAPEFVSDFYRHDYYRNSPIDDPTGPTFAPQHGVRGNLTLGGYLASPLSFNSLTFPSPAWGRERSSMGSVRCARSDDAVGSSQEDLIRARHDIQHGSWPPRSP